MRREIDAGQRLQHVPRDRPLQREQRVARARVHRHRIADALDVLGDPVEVLHDVRRVDDEHEVLVRQPVGQHVVHERALRRRQRGILRLPDGQAAGVVRRDVLDRGQRVGARDLDLPHVADVEQPGARAHGHVLVDDAGVFDRHVPAAELDHPGAEGAMPGVERGFLEGRRARLRHGI